jgi:prepilin-type N-terminal cleavage/methylation domain-containing protein
MHLPTHNKAFTLLEVLVVMILSGILLSLTLLALRIIWSQYIKASRHTEETAALNRLTHRMERDFEQADRITRQPSGLSFHRQNQQVLYEPAEDYWLRIQDEVTDTFYLPPRQLQCFYLKKQLLPAQTLLDELIFETEFREEKLIFHFIKHYDAQTLMQTETP